MDYGDKPAAAKRSLLTPPRWSLFAPPLTRWGEILIPFVCMIGAGERQEMEQFYVVNSNAKSVRTDLAMDLLKQRAESDPDTWSDPLKVVQIY